MIVHQFTPQRLEEIREALANEQAIEQLLLGHSHQLGSGLTETLARELAARVREWINYRFRVEIER